MAAAVVAAHFATLASGSSLHGAGKLSALMVTGPSRLPALPGVPTAREVGVDGMDFNQWWAVVAPATTPVEIVERLRLEVVAARETCTSWHSAHGLCATANGPTWLAQC